MTTQRQAIQLPQVGVQGPAQLQVQDSFGVSQVASDPNKRVLNTLLKFGNKVAADEMDKEIQANYVAGQSLRRSNAELTGKEPLPTKKGYAALNAKLQAQQLMFDEKQRIDEGLNATDPKEYAPGLGDRFKDYLTGDPMTDQILTASMGEYAAELGRYQADANYKKRTADGISQATADVRNHILAIKDSQNKGDVQGEAGAREGLIQALSLPTVQNESLRQQLYGDLAVMGLEQDDPTALNYVREQGIQFDTKQESRIASATAAYNTKQKRKLDTKYQNDVADFEANVAGAKTIYEHRLAAKLLQVTYPDRITNKYIISQEDAFRRGLAKSSLDKIVTDAYREGRVAQIGVSNKEMQAQAEAVNAQVYSDESLSPEDKEKEVIRYWQKNGIVRNSLKTELTAGLSVPLLDGKMHPNFEQAFYRTLEHFKVSPDLTMRHLSEDQSKLFRELYAATTTGGQELGDAVLRMEQHRVNRAELTREDMQDFRDEIGDAVDEVLGKGFYNWTMNGFKTFTNEAEVRTRITELANIYLNQGMANPEAAVEAARDNIKKTHEQLGNSLIFNNGTPIHERMGIEPARTEEAMDYLYDSIEKLDPSFDRSQSMLLGNPKEGTLFVGKLSEDKILLQTYPYSFSDIGAAFKEDVIQPELAQAEAEEAAAVQNSQDQMSMIKDAQELLGWSKEDAETATSNFIGRFITEQRINSARADQKLIERYGTESQDELENLKVMKEAFSPGNTLSKEQVALLEDGRVDEYKETLAPEPDVSNMTSLEAFIFKHEGFSATEYLDTKGVPTIGIGQTGEFRDMSFRQAVQKKRDLAEKKIPDLNTFPETVQNNIVSSFYRGSLSGSPKTIALINKGMFQEAAEEFLDNREYREARKSGSGVARRMEEVAIALASMPNKSK